MHKFLYGNGINVKRKSYLWNLFASVVNAAEAIVIIVVASRVVTLSDVGILTFAFTLANLIMCIGKYGVRNYQVSDLTDAKEFSAYYYSRLFTILFALFFTIAFSVYSVFFNGYEMPGLICTILVVLIYLIEAYEDVFISEIQRRGRLDVGAKIFCIRWIITLLAWTICLLLLRNIVLATTVAFFVNTVIAILLTSVLIKDFGIDKTINFKNCSVILKDCLPICLATVFSIYLPNAAKYSIDGYLNNNVQAIYGYIAMPIFVLDVVSFVIFQPKLLDLANAWKKRDEKALKRIIISISALLLIISVLCIISSWFLGIPLLSVLYKEDLREYKLHFMIIMLGSVALAYLGFFASILTVIRKQVFMLIAYATFSIMTFFMTGFLLAAMLFPF